MAVRPSPSLADEDLARARWAARHHGIHLSKSTIRTFRTCPHAYRLEKISKLPACTPLSLARARGIAVHAAIEDVLRHPDDPDWEYRATTVLEQVPELAVELPALLRWVGMGRHYVLGLGGRITLLEDFATLDRGASAGFLLHARLDAVVDGGSRGGVEVVDFKTTTRCPSVDAVRLDGEAGIHRLILGGITPVRPIRTTQLHLPTATPVTVKLSDEDVLTAWNDVVEARDAIGAALANGAFPAQPGGHCAWCGYRDVCPDAAG